MYNKDKGYVLRSEHQTLWQALIFMDVMPQVPFNKREAKWKEKNQNMYTSFVCGGGGDISV